MAISQRPWQVSPALTRSRPRTRADSRREAIAERSLDEQVGPARGHRARPARGQRGGVRDRSPDPQAADCRGAAGGMILVAGIGFRAIMAGQSLFGLTAKR